MVRDPVSLGEVGGGSHLSASLLRAMTNKSRTSRREKEQMRLKIFESGMEKWIR